MNSEVEIHIGNRQNVLAVPNAALRTPRDVASAAQVLGLDLQTVQQQLRRPRRRAPPRETRRTPAAARGRSDQAGRAGDLHDTQRADITLPPGVTPEQVQAAFAKRMSGAELSPAEQALLSSCASHSRAEGRGGGREPSRTARPTRERARATSCRAAGRKIMAVPIRTGLTDQDYIEVARGLTQQDTVLVLPSASLVQSQQQFRQRFQNVTAAACRVCGSSRRSRDPR